MVIKCTINLITFIVLYRFIKLGIYIKNGQPQILGYSVWQDFQYGRQLTDADEIGMLAASGYRLIMLLGS